MRIGSLCTGYGGLDMAVEATLGGQLAWVSDIDKGACKIIAHRFRDVPNLGDLTALDWAEIEPVDILTAGYPCQPFSHAGRRQGTDDERHLWPYIRQAVRHLRPRITVLENVAGHRSMGFDRVLADMAEDGLHVRWASLRAADVGACHGRERLFIVVTDPRGEVGELGAGLRASEPAGLGRGQSARGHSQDGLTLLPTPAVNDMGAGKTVDDWDAWTDRMKAVHGNGNGHGKSLAIEAQRLLPTPTARDHKDGGYVAAVPENALLGRVVWRLSERFGEYAAAVAQWEAVLGRPAPDPTEPTGKGGAHRLSPRFVEFMMGLPAGWVTDVPTLTRNEALKALGNGVVPMQAEAALRHMLAMAVAA